MEIVVNRGAIHLRSARNVVDGCSAVAELLEYRSRSGKNRGASLLVVRSCELASAQSSLGDFADRRPFFLHCLTFVVERCS